MAAPTEPSASVNLDAIAAHLNLSTATVSRALRNVPGTHPRTKSLVMNAAAELGYRPQRTRTRSAAQKVGRQAVAVLARGFRSGRNLAFLEGMTLCSNELNVSLVLQKSGSEGSGDELGAIKGMLAREGDLAGIALIHRWPTDIVRFLADQYNCVSLIHHYPGLAVDVVDMNHVQGMTQMVNHLYELGHRRIGFIGRNAELSWAKARFGGFSQTLYGLGLPYEGDRIVDVPTAMLERADYVAEWNPLIDRVQTLVRDGVTAWMASSDWVGYALSRGLAERGVRVPDEVSLTGFDTDERQTLGCARLTSVNVPKEQMGSESLRRLLRRFDEPQQAQLTSLFGCALSVGETTGAVRETN